MLPRSQALPTKEEEPGNEATSHVLTVCHYFTSLFPGCTMDIMSLFYFTSLFPGCTVDIMTSGHSPVFATFQIGGVKQYASEAGLRSRVGGRENRGGEGKGREDRKGEAGGRLLIRGEGENTCRSRYT